jgi:hypothetical protein
MMEADGGFETLLPIYKSTRRHIPEYNNLFHYHEIIEVVTTFLCGETVQFFLP